MYSRNSEILNPEDILKTSSVSFEKFIESKFVPKEVKKMIFKLDMIGGSN